MRPLNLLSIAGLAIAAAGCGADSVSAPVGDTTPSFSLVVRGDRVANSSGVSLVQYFVNGWREETNNGATKYSSDVTLLLLSSLADQKAPQVNIGLLGRPVVGSYRVRAVGAALGEKPEFYGSYRVVNSDSTATSFDATTGTVTITATSPVIKGTFSFHSTRSVTVPAVLTPGMSFQAVPASLDVSGSFVAKAP